MATKKVVIVESPAKAKTIQKFVDSNTKVKPTFGHVRDLPKSKLGISVEDNFEPKYIIPTKAKTVIKDLKNSVKDADIVYLATDPDREGEAISWHVVQALDLAKDEKTQIFRITFHEITDSAIKKALDHPGQLNQNLIDAQQARRVLDRLVGYELSPLLWKKIYRGLSAGRVQSAALRLIVDREGEIKAFKTQEYWSLWATFETAKKEKFRAKLTAYKGKPLEKYPPESLIKEGQTYDKPKGWQVSQVTTEHKQRHPYAPFTTSTLQQDASRKLHFTAKQTMMYAQKLYEGITIGNETVGLITYMRTDSVQLASSAISEARQVIEKEFGLKYVPNRPRTYITRTKGAQEAHEAIRPTSFYRKPADVKNFLSPQEHKLYTLVWNRALASQMISADTEATKITIQWNEAMDKITYTAWGLTLLFPGFLKLYEETQEDINSNGESEESEQILPKLKERDPLSLESNEAKQHFTQPPPRFTEASLVKEMEKRGIGRPSTYAPTISTLVDRGYVIKEERKFFPQEIGEIVINLLKDKFPSIVDLDFTAELEEELDDIAEGTKEWQPVVKEFYDPFKKLLVTAEKEIESKSLSETPTDEKCPLCGKPLIIKLGRYGKFYACTGFPECRYTRPHGDTKVLDEKQKEIEASLVGRKCPKDNGELIMKSGRFGPFIGCANYPNCKYIEAINNEIGVKCPKDGGEIVQKRTRRGKLFWGCSHYPKCTFASWDKPIARPCPKCKGLLTEKKSGIVCINGDYTESTKEDKTAHETVSA